jgi:hypothetical protein
MAASLASMAQTARRSTRWRSSNLRRPWPIASHRRLACIVRGLTSMASSEDPLWHELDAGSAVEGLATDPECGLGEAAMRDLAGRFGPNELPAARQRSLWVVFLSQSLSPLNCRWFAGGLVLGNALEVTVLYVPAEVQHAR